MKGIEKMMRNVIFDHHEQVVGPMLVKIDERLDGVENRLDGVENRLGEVESRMSQIDWKLDKVAEIVTDVKANHERRIRAVEDEVEIKPTVRLNF